MDEVTYTIANLPAIQQIFVDAAGDLAGMLQPIMTAGIVIVLGVTAFAVGKRLFSKSVN